MLTDSERNHFISEIEHFPQEVAEAVTHLNDQQLDTPYRKGAWTVRQAVHHLADSHMNAYVRMKLGLTEEQPTIKPYDQDRWAELEDATSFPVQISIDILQAIHRRWTLLLKSLPDSAWTRTINHPESGVLSLDDLVKAYANHGRSHLKSIRSLLDSRGW